MAKYLVRVELHGATWDEYERLHSEMANRGFSREVTSDNSGTYRLPTAEYVIQTSHDLEGLRARCRGRKNDRSEIRSDCRGILPERLGRSGACVGGRGGFAASGERW